MQVRISIKCCKIALYVIDIAEVDNLRLFLTSCRLSFLMLIVASCASSNNVAIQNTTARYNVMYNAKNLLSDYLKATDRFNVDDFSSQLTVFPRPMGGEDPVLDSIIHKANKVIKTKNRSNYVDDAYFLIAEANFFKGNFHEAAEFYRYIYTTYPKESSIPQLSRLKRARAFLLLNEIDSAAAMVDSASKYMDNRQQTSAGFHAMKAELLIAENKPEEAEQALTLALAANPEKSARKRWTFVLAQLQEKNKKKELALENYKGLRKTIAPTDLSFQADISHARLYEELHGSGDNYLKILQDFLSKHLYDGYKDRVFYLMGRVNEENKNWHDAVENYKNSLRTTRSAHHKGLVFAGLANSYSQVGLHKAAKVYYDSALVSISGTNAQYEVISKRAADLAELAPLLEKVHFEETVRSIAGMPQDLRYNAITEILRLNELEEGAYPASGTLMNSNPNVSEGSFYFDNQKALAQGLLDFQARWGNRTLRDNWRYEEGGSAANEEQQQTATIIPTKNNAEPDTGKKRRFDDYLSNLPLTSDALEASDERLAAYLYGIGVTYLNKLQDEQQATLTFEKITTRFPRSSSALPAYYQLFLITRRTNPETAGRYERVILTDYPNSEIATTIQNARALFSEGNNPALTTYAHIYDLFAKKRYAGVLEQVKRFRQNKESGELQAQLDYLYLISMGYSQTPSAFQDSLFSFMSRHSEDSLVTPLVRQHLHYIDQNRAAFLKRPVALVNNEISYPDENIAELSMAFPTKPVHNEVLATPKPVVSAEPDTRSFPQPEEAAAKETPKAHYFVINVLSATTNLAPSRFGIGQFNRSMYPQAAIKHQLKVVNKENQLIFVGPFHNKEEASAYEARILPMIKDIMKVPTEKYNTFVISAERFEQLNTRVLIDSYVEHIKKIK